MMYEASLTKAKTYWWDEDKEGSCMFAAANDKEAMAFIATAVLCINRRYQGINEPRDVSVEALTRLQEKGFSIYHKRVSVSNLEPMKGVRSISLVLRTFYPRTKEGRQCIAPRFTSFKVKPVNWHNKL